MGVLDKFDDASNSTATVWLILNKALAAEWRRLSTELDAAAAQDDKSGSLALPATRAVVDQMDAIRDQVAASKVYFEFDQVDWADFLELQAEHPPREGKVVDQINGYNVRTFPVALIKLTCVSVTDSDGDVATEVPDSKWAKLIPTLNQFQMEELFRSAKGVNTEGSSTPPSARSLLGSQDSGASLAQPSPGKDRPRRGSAGGSRRTSPKSSATKKAESPDS